MLLRFVIAACLALAIGTDMAFGRKWTDKAGKYSIEAEFLEVVDGQVLLKRDDGKTGRVPLDNLSEADQTYVREIIQASRAKKSFAPKDDKPVAEVPSPSSAVGASEGSGAASGQEQAKQSIRTVVVEGVGLTEKEARDNAFSNAVQSAIGVLVDATTLVKNDQLITDKVLTYSNGYIQQFKVISTSSKGGTTRTRIQADVKIDMLTAKLTELAVIGKRAVDGASMAAEVTTKEKRRQDALALIAEATRGFPATVLKTTVGKPVVAKNKQSAETELLVPVTVEADMEKYKAFDKQFRKVLEAMARTQVQYACETECSTGKSGRFPFFRIPPDGIAAYAVIQHRVEDMKALKNQDDSEKSEMMTILLYDNHEKGFRRIKWTAYGLDREYWPVFNQARDLVLDVLVRLVDAKGEVIAEKSRDGCFRSHEDSRECRLEGIAASQANINFAMTSAAQFPDIPFLESHAQRIGVGPFFVYGDGYARGVFAPELRLSMPFKLTPEEIDQIRNVECVLSLKPGTSAFSTTPQPK